MTIRKVLVIFTLLGSCVLLPQQSFASAFCSELLSTLGEPRLRSLREAQARDYSVSVLSGMVGGRKRIVVLLGQHRVKDILAARVGREISRQYTFQGRGHQEPEALHRQLKAALKATWEFIKRLKGPKRHKFDSNSFALSREALLQGMLENFSKLLERGDLTKAELDLIVIKHGSEELTIEEIVQELRMASFSRTVNLEAGRDRGKNWFSYYFGRSENMAANVQKNLLSSPDEQLMLVVVGKRYAYDLQYALATSLGLRTVQILEPLPYP